MIFLFVLGRLPALKLDLKNSISRNSQILLFSPGKQKLFGKYD